MGPRIVKVSSKEGKKTESDDDEVVPKASPENPIFGIRAPSSKPKKKD